MTITKAILLASDIPVLLAAILVIIYFRRFDKKLRPFSLFIICSAMVQIIALICWFLEKNNMPLLHIYVPIGFALLAWFYQSLLEKLINKGIIVTMVLLFFLFSVVNSIFFQSVFTFNSIALTIESILIIILSIFTFIVFLNQQPDLIERPLRLSLSWINSGLFIYYSSTLLLFYFSNYVMQHYSVNVNAYTWIFHSFSSIVMYSCFIIGLWKQAKECL